MGWLGWLGLSRDSYEGGLDKFSGGGAQRGGGRDARFVPEEGRIARCFSRNGDESRGAPGLNRSTNKLPRKRYSARNIMDSTVSTLQLWVRYRIHSIYFSRFILELDRKYMPFSDITEDMGGRNKVRVPK